MTDRSLNDRRWLHWLLRRAREAMRDNSWLLPAIGGIAGLLLAQAVGTGGGDEDAGWTVTVDRSRNTLLGLVALLFTALSIVLALASVAAQNVVNRFGSRTLRLYLRHSPARILLGMFCLTTAFVIVEQFQLRKLPPGDPAPVAGLVISVLLLIITATLMIAYVASVIRWFRVDAAALVLQRSVREAAESAARTRRDTQPLAAIPDRPAKAIDLRAPRSGYLAEIDAEELLDQMAGTQGVATITRGIGAAVVAGAPIGWVDADGATPDIEVHDVIDIARTRELTDNIEYGLVGMVDVAIIALSPAVNDPNTAVEVVEELSFLLHALHAQPLGPYAVPHTQSTPRVVVSARSFGKLVELATTQIVLYGRSDPMVHRALRQLADSLLDLELNDEDRRAVDHFASRLDQS